MNINNSQLVSGNFEVLTFSIQNLHDYDMIKYVLHFWA